MMMMVMRELQEETVMVRMTSLPSVMDTPYLEIIKSYPNNICGQFYFINIIIFIMTIIIVIILSSNRMSSKKSRSKCLLQG